MLQHVISQWDENKHLLKKWFEESNQDFTYSDIVEKLFELVITKDSDGFNSYSLERLTVIDHGNYQGTTLYLITTDTYQPSASDYLVTDNYYGSCSGCDTLLSIQGYTEEKPSASQVEEYMTLALHLVQKMRSL